MFRIPGFLLGKISLLIVLGSVLNNAHKLDSVLNYGMVLIQVSAIFQKEKPLKRKIHSPLLELNTKY